MLDLLVKVVLAYLLGSVSGSMVLGALRHVDIRNSGSGNAGGTNAFRTQGVWFALGVGAIDIGKGTLATGLIPALGLALPGQPFSTEAQMLACGFAAVIGHCFPIWYGFRGGKGAATAVGVLAVIQPLILAPMLLTWLLVLVLTGWVGLATMVAACSLIPLFFWLGVSPAMQWFALALAAFIVLMHRSNIAKMIRRTEHRFQRVRIVNWFR
jgi:glycerol-3-phosphate acyltransferase PlsY